MNDIDPKLLKIIALAREGIGGEKETAIRIVKKICAEQGLNFDDVMSSSDARKYELHIKYRNEFERTIIVQTIFRFALTDEHPNLQGNNHYKEFYYTTTPSKHIETVNAANVYLNAFRKERKKFMKDLAHAFVQKHRLYSTLTDDDDEEMSLPTVEDLEAYERRAAIASGMDDVQVQKTIEEKAS